MKKILIIGAGGFGREVQWLIERINQKTPKWQIIGYLDDSIKPGIEINGYPVIGNIEQLKNFDKNTAVVCAIGSAGIRKRIVSRIKQIGPFEFPNLIDPNVQMSQTIMLGEGNIICAGNILTVNICIEDFVIINLSCTIGHDAILRSFVTVYPGVNISGCTETKSGTELGTGSKVIQGKMIGEHTIIGAGAVVVNNIPADCTAMGIPAKPVKFHGGGGKDLLIVGFGGHGKVLADLAEKTGCYQNIYFLDDDVQVQSNARFIIGNSDYAITHKDEYDVIVAIGEAGNRRKILEKYEAAGICPVSLVHPEAILPKENILVGRGTVIMAGAVIQSGTELGKGIIVNTASSIDHDCSIGDFSHIAVGSHLAGNVTVGSNTWIGIGAEVSNNLRICENVIVGAGAAVVKDIVESGVYIGVPAEKLK